MRPESLPKENAQMSRRYRHGHPNLTLFPEVDLSPRVDTSWSPGNNVPFGPPDVLHRRQRLRRCCSRRSEERRVGKEGSGAMAGLREPSAERSDLRRIYVSACSGGVRIE